MSVLVRGLVIKITLTSSQVDSLADTFKVNNVTQSTEQPSARREYIFVPVALPGFVKSLVSKTFSPVESRT